MFDSLSEKLEGVFKQIRGHGKLTEDNVRESVKQIKRALLEADVNYKVVKRFTEDVKSKALGEQVLTSITPGQQFIRIVFEELKSIMGEGAREISFAPSPPTVIMVVGLQGSGKTTASAKLARRFRQKGKKGMLIAADIYRPAAVDQLDTLAKAVPVEVYYERDNGDPPPAPRGESFGPGPQRCDCRTSGPE